MNKTKKSIAIMMALPLLAEAEHEGTLVLDEVHVVAERPKTSSTQPSKEAAKEALSKTAGGTTLVDMDKVREGRVSTYQDSLGLATGVYIQSRFGAEESRLSIRGSGLQRTFHGRGLKLMQDGVPVNLADGSFDFQAIEPLAASYVEVYRGANALRYGASNLGGAINFLSHTGYTAPRLEARYEAGTYDYSRASVSTGEVIGDLDYYVNASYFDQRGFRDFADQMAHRVNANVGYKISPDIETRFYVGYTHSDSNLPGNLTKAQLKNDPSDAFLGSVGQQKRNIDLFRIANKTNIQLSDQSSLQVSGYFSHKDLFHPIFQVVDQDTNDYGIDIRFQHKGELVGHRNEFILGFNPSAGVGYDERNVNLQGRKGALVNKLENRSRNLEAYAENRFFVTDGLTLIAGLQYTHSQRNLTDKFFSNASQNESFKATYVQTNPKIGVLYDLKPNVQLFANLSRSYEPPSFGELAGGIRPNIVKAQEGTTFEVGSRGNSESIDWDVAVYYGKLKNELLQTAVFAAGNNPVPAAQTTNADRTIHAGLEFGMTARLPLNIEWRHSLLVNRFKFDGDNTFGNNTLPGIQKSLMRAELMYRGNDRLNGIYFGPTFEWSPQDYYVDFAETFKADSYFLWGLKAGQKVNQHWSWFVEGRNLADQKYAATTSVVRNQNGADGALFLPGDGRTAYLGVTWTY
ncbi:TonB-dependent receptor family protein [Methylophilus medardicus]|uniref:TonB-dependent receptor n=1 Tax=Methylophilus medardicus TaxID=2588534 RepID=A0A5B8CQM7_9PROT|nr:TonB-dependent receptor [Methylophilus medardicus]QDC43542.1 TonB-dependent receptor [Methylophilus medardicus]QDC48549.1 TonB-dependent receptor [Methylophilus medardicus]QDC52254.1 TonB-dependent receptor [Methylophilus medardicus]